MRSSSTPSIGFCCTLPVRADYMLHVGGADRSDAAQRGSRPLPGSPQLAGVPDADRVGRERAGPGDDGDAIVVGLAGAGLVLGSTVATPPTASGYAT
jgi:hypothetical protein